MTKIMYDDGRVVLDQYGLLIRRYFFPVGDKRILWGEFKDVVAHHNALGRWRIWGGGFGRWYNLDPKRVLKKIAFMVDKGDSTRAVVTPDDPDAFRAALEARGVVVRKAG